MTRQIRRLATQVLFMLLTVGAAHAADWPTREIKLIVPFGPGGGADLIARVVGQELGNRLGKQVVVENKPGASATIGVRQVADAEPDGYTIGLFTAVHPVNVATGQPIPYDADRDLAYLTTLIRTPLLLLANPKRNFKTLSDIVEFGKKNPDKLTAGSLGVGTPHHLLMEWLAVRTGFHMSVAPYKTTHQSVQAVMTGEVDLAFTGLGGNVEEFIGNGSLTLIAVTSSERLERWPNVPTMLELGMDGFPGDSWYGMIAPAKTPQAIQKRLGDELRSVMANPEVTKKIAAAGAIPSTSTAAEFGEIVRKDTESYKAIVQAVNAAKK